MRRLLLCGAAVALATVVWWHFRADNSLLSPAHPDSAARRAPELPVASVLQVRPNATRPAPVSEGSAPSVSPAMAQFRERRDFAALHRSVSTDPATPESLYLRAEIYWACAKRADSTDVASTGSVAERRAKFIAGLARSGPVSEKRVEAFDRLASSPCMGLDLGRFDRQVMMGMVAAAAEAGDAHAQAWQMAERIERAHQEAQQVSRRAGGYELNEADFEQARRLLASGDAEVILDLQGVLSSTLAQGVIQLGGTPVDPGAMHAALSLLACDAGAQCGAESRLLSMSCAYRGRCDAGSYYEYLYYYESSPNEAQQIDAYRRTLSAMMRSGDFSGLTYSQGGVVPGFTMTFGGRRTFGGNESAGSGASNEPPPPKSLSHATET